MSRKKIIEQKLAVLSPHILEVTDESLIHAGHSGNPDGSGDTHFTVVISSHALNDLNKLQQHRMINNLLKDEFSSGLHALTIKILPTE